MESGSPQPNGASSLLSLSQVPVGSLPLGLVPIPGFHPRNRAGATAQTSRAAIPVATRVGRGTSAVPVGVAPATRGSPGGSSTGELGKLCSHSGCCGQPKVT